MEWLRANCFFLAALAALSSRHVMLLLPPDAVHSLQVALSLHRERFINAPSSDEGTTGQITGGAFGEIRKNKKSTF